MSSRFSALGGRFVFYWTARSVPPSGNKDLSVQAFISQFPIGAFRSTRSPTDCLARYTAFPCPLSPIGKASSAISTVRFSLKNMNFY
jgi:hypothetical protein